MLKIKNKKLLPILCILATVYCLCGCVEKQEAVTLIQEELLTSEQANYKTIQVKMGDYEKETSGKVTIFYPVNEKLYWEDSTVYFKESLVKTGQEVKKGEVLMCFDTEENKVSRESLKLQIARAWEEAQKQDISKLEALDAAKAKAESLQGYEEKIAWLQVEKLQAAYERFLYETEKSINRMQEQLEELEQIAGKNVLVAPFDGVIDEITRWNAGDKVSSGQYLISMYSTDRLLFLADNNSNKLRYNMDVIIEVGKNDNAKSYKGKVIAASHILPSSVRGSFTLIEPEEKLTEADLKGNIKYRAVAEEVRNILQIKGKAIEREEGKEFVYVLDGDMVQKRYIKTTLNAVEAVWVLDGLSEGQTLIID